MIRLPPRPEGARSLAAALAISDTAAAVLVKRGFAEPDAARFFFDPKLANLTSPVGMKDRNEAAVRIARAVRAKERVCIFGDYDADGVTSAALMTDVLRTLGADVTTLLADRFEGGYGLSGAALARVFDTGATLLITCDCGTSDHARLDDARKRGLDVIVIDHHRVPDEPLPALAFLNPHRPDCGFAYKGLASVGLALSICAGVRAELGVQIDLRQWLDLVALGTIADVAPLDGDNRALVRAGLAQLGKGARHGTRALAEVAKVNAAYAISGEDVAFRYAPRINAPGRLKKPDLALALLLSRDPHEARMLAAELDQVCEQRKAIDRAVLAEAEIMLADPALAALPVIVLGKEGWHQGVVGIVAGRLASRFGKPTIVIGFDGATGRGSVRGPAGFPLYTALDRVKDTLLGFGGHQAAAGVHVAAASLEALRERFASECVALGLAADVEPPCLDVDAVLAEGDEPARVLADLERFEPCGQANPAPVLGFERARVIQTRLMKEVHLAMDLAIGRVQIRAFGFGLGKQVPAVGAHVHVVGRLRRDDFRGNGAVEIRIETLEPA
jgi:single-stranded-DNA-specific exonuclease